jgi:hypothetical protein
MSFVLHRSLFSNETMNYKDTYLLLDNLGHAVNVHCILDNGLGGLVQRVVDLHSLAFNQLSESITSLQKIVQDLQFFFICIIENYLHCIDNFI